MTTIAINASEIKVGDLIRAHGVTFRVTEVSVYPHGWTAMRRDEFGPPSPVFVGKTDVVRRDETSPMPKHWADTWVLQGNRRAMFQKVAA